MIKAGAMDPLKKVDGLDMEGATAHERGKIHELVKGPRGESNGAEKERSKGISPQTNPRYARKGGSVEKLGAKNHGREKELEREMQIGEKRVSHALKPSQDQGCCKGYIMKQDMSRKERNPRKGREGSVEEKEEERGEGRRDAASVQETIGGKLSEKTSAEADTEAVGAKTGSRCEAGDTAGSDLRGVNQVVGHRRCWCRNSGMRTDDSRNEAEEEVESRVGKRVEGGEDRPGSCDGNRSESSGRAPQLYRKGQEEKEPGSGQIIGAGMGSGTVRESGRELGWPNGSNPVMGLFYRAALSPASSTRDLVNEMYLNESPSSSFKPADLEPGLCQVVVSKTVTKEVCSGSTGLSIEEGQKGNDIKCGGGDESEEIAGQVDGYRSMNRYDDKRYFQHTPISISVFGRPLLLGGFSGQGVVAPDKTMVPFRVEAADDRNWGSPVTSFEVGVGYGGDDQRKTKCNFDLVENRKYGRWESSCLVKFSEFLGFPTKGFEKEIMNLLEKLVASQTRGKVKGCQSVSKSERELRRLRSTVNYNGNKSNKEGGRDRGNLLLKLK